jgi:hypothetical protein
VAEEPLVFGFGAEPHQPFDPRAVVPTAVEDHELAGRRHVRDVSLEVPLRALAIRRLGQCHHAHLPRVEAPGQRRDRSAFAGRVTPLQHDHHSFAGLLQPVGQLIELAFEQLEVLLVLFALQW